MSEQDDSNDVALHEAALPCQIGSDADIDASLLEDSLRLTPWQRLVENDRSLALVRMLERARIKSGGTPHTNS